ncbi:tetratricopeptide repeat protein [Natrinema thermotolerans]
MEWGPDWIPDLDEDDILSSDNLLTDIRVTAAAGSISALDPHVLGAIGFIGTTIASKKIADESQQIGNKAREYVEKHDDPENRREAYKIKLANAVGKILPGREDFEPIDKIHDPDVFAEVLSEYIKDETWQEEANRRIESLITGDFETLATEDQSPDDILIDIFDADTEEEAIAHLFNLQDLITMQILFDVRQEVEDIADSVEDLEENLEQVRDTVRSNVRQQLSIQIENQGFYRITPLYLTEYAPDPETAWQRPFYLSEVRKNYAAKRMTPDRELESSQILHEKISRRLKDGDDIRLVGQPGTGKSTVCKQVIDTWYDEGYGPVLYRPSGGTFQEAGGLYEYITRLSEQGHILIVVEDALQDRVRDLLDVVARLSDRSDVSFLLETRQLETDHELDIGFDHGATRGQQLVAGLDTIEVIEMPPLSVKEIKEIISRFEDKTGEEIPESAADLHNAIETDSGIGEVLLLGYHLRGGESEGSTAFERTVRSTLSVVEKHASQEDEPWKSVPHDDIDLVRDLVLYVNVLNVLGIAITKEIILAFDPDRKRRIIETLDAFDGWLLFDEPRVDGTTRYTTYHKQWSLLYLEALFKSVPSLTRTRIAQALEGVGNYLEKQLTDAERHDLVKSVPQGEVLDDKLDTPSGIEYIILLFSSTIISHHPRLTPLIGDGSNYITDYLKCLGIIEVVITNSCTQGYLALGMIDEAADHHDIAMDKLESIDGNPTSLHISCLTDKMHIALHRHDYDTAEQTVLTANELLEEGELTSDERKISHLKFLSMLGAIQHRDGEVAEAVETLDSARSKLDQIDHSGLEFFILSELAVAKMDVNEYDDADDILEQALASAEGGSRSKLAVGYGNRARLASIRGDSDQGISYAERAIKLYRQLGDQVGEARARQNLASLYLNDERYDEAVEEAEIAISLFKQTKEPKGLSKAYETLAEIHHKHSDGVVDESKIFKKASEDFRELGFSEFQAEFERRYKYEEVDHPEVKPLLELGLEMIQNGDDARPVLKEAWRRRTLHQSDCGAYLLALRAGLALRAYEELYGYEPEISGEELEKLYHEVYDHLDHREICKGLADAVFLRRPTPHISLVLGMSKPRKDQIKRHEFALAKEAINFCVFGERS